MSIDLKAASRSTRVGRTRMPVVMVFAGLTFGLGACGGGGEEEASAKTTKAAAVSLQQAMDASSRGIDGVRGTRSSLERLSSTLQSSIDQTNDVIGLLTPRAGDSPTEAKLLQAARDQRSFLQLASEAASSRTRGTALGSVARARDTGRRTTGSYTAAAQQTADLAGLLPASTTFNTGRLRDAVAAATKPTTKKKPTTTNTPVASGNNGSSGSSCGGGISVNSATTCPFARNVASEYSASGGDSVIEVYSPVTGQSYTMSCGSGVPVVCTGGNNAQVTIR